jgi:hypothetical protein
VTREADSQAARAFERLERDMSDDIYAEFDDVWREGEFVSSVKARVEIGRLASKHGLAFSYNAAGGSFYRTPTPFECQISTKNDVDDLAIFRAALIDARLESNPLTNNES